MKINTNIEYAVGTLRVSSTKQGLQGDSHEDQKIQIERKVTQLSASLGKSIVIKKWFKITESASVTIDMQPVNEAIDYCSDPKNKIKYFFFKSVDRMTRGGSVIYGLLRARLAKAGVQCADVYGVVGYKETNTLEHLGMSYEWSMYSPTWITEILEAERSKGEVRDILTRMIGAEINYVQLGYHVRASPPGFKNHKIETSHGSRVVLIPHEIESPWFVRMFELRNQGNLSDLEIVKEINKMGFKSRITKKHDSRDKTKIIGKSGDHPLTIKQFQRYIQNPIYAGVNTEKWSNGKPIKTVFEGIVSIEMFNKANKGKITIVKEDDGYKVYKGKPDLWRLRKLKENSIYPYKQQVLCPKCKKSLLGSASRSKSGKHIPRYHCARGHKFWSKNSIEFDKTIKNFVENIQFSGEYRQRFREIVLEEWEKRKEHSQVDSITSEERVTMLRREQKLTTDKIKMLTSLVTIKSLEEDVEKLENDIVQAMQIRDAHEDKILEIQTLINFSDYFMEHLEDLLLGGTDPMKNAVLFGLVFDQVPTYDEITNGTPSLAPIVKLNEEYKKSKSLSVGSVGFEPTTVSLRGSCSTN